MKTKHWTLNADVGEGCDDAVIMPYLDCANVACAAHAGDKNVVRKTLALAKQYRVIVGAHPGYPDKENFGRYSLNLNGHELRATLIAQIQLLQELAVEQAIGIQYIKPHGALNHDMLQKPAVFEVICQVAADMASTMGEQLALMIPTNAKQAQQQHMAASYGLAIWWEVFADRAYEPTGLLRSRRYTDAVHADPNVILEQLNRIRQQGEIIAVDGSVLDISYAQTICIHGDHPPSITAVQAA